MYTNARPGRTARLAEVVDDFDGDHVGGTYRLERHVAIDDSVEFKQFPQPAGHIHIAETAGVGPGDVAHARVDDIGIVGEGDGIVIGEVAKLLRVALAVVKNDGALPAAFPVGVEFAEVGDELLARPRLGADALDESEVPVLRASLGTRVLAERHRGLPDPWRMDPGSVERRPSLHRLLVADTPIPREILAWILKKALIFCRKCER